MAEVMTQPPTSPSRKRTHDGEFVESHLMCDTINYDSNPSTESISRHASPAPSTAISDLTELTSSIASPASKPGLTSDLNHAIDGSASVKKRKLTFAEREVEKAVKKRDREEKERIKAEEKRQKDEEKRQREEEKEVVKREKELQKAEKKKAEDAKKAERDEKKKIKDAEKQEKDAEKAKREEEKVKKEKAQLRIGAFFGRPAPASTPPSTPDRLSVEATSRRSSIASIDLTESCAAPATRTIATANPEFDKYIIPYFIHEHTNLAPTNRFLRCHTSTRQHEDGAEYKIETEQQDLAPIRERFIRHEKRFRYTKPVKQIVEGLRSEAPNPEQSETIQAALSSVPMKIISFVEDVRPPYFGTYSTNISSSSRRKMSRRPAFRGRPDTNYDYDSEAEWEPPAEDDDDINLEDELSESEDDEDEMQDFLDDENDAGRRRMFVGEMEPISSGLCWAGETSAINTTNMEEYRMSTLHDSTTFPIDPFSTTHWSDDTKPKATQVKNDIKTKGESNNTIMPPPRLPLVPVNAPNTLQNYAALLNSRTNPQAENPSSTPATVGKQKGRPPNPNKELKMISDEFLPAFKEAIKGSDLTKAGLIEILKKQFPKCSKDAIKDTLGIVAARVGKKESEKRWELI